jgi:hypothetical protein
MPSTEDELALAKAPDREHAEAFDACIADGNVLDHGRRLPA